MLSDLTLEQIWNSRVVPDMEPVAENTMLEYRSTINLWNDLTDNPPVGTIGRQTIRDFRDKLMSTPFRRGKKKKAGKRSHSTVNRIMRDLHVIMSPCWPADRMNLGGLGAMPFFQWPKSLTVQKKLPFVFSPHDLSKLYLKVDACRQPSKFARTTPMNEPRLWRLALALALNSAPRTWDMFALPKSAVRLKEDDENFQYGSLVFVAKKTGKLHRIPLNECAARHLDDILRRPVRGTSASELLFPGFNKGAAFYSTWRRITAAAGVSGTFESMRKTSVTRHNTVVWQAGYWLSGHLEPGVFGHYDNPSERIFEAVYGLPQPQAFREGMLNLAAMV